VWLVPCCNCSIPNLKGRWAPTYRTLVARLLTLYPPTTKLFLGCGPMSQTRFFCPDVTAIVREQNSSRVNLIDFRDPTLVLKGCLDHPNW
jgi:hypothetical protein